MGRKPKWDAVMVPSEFARLRQEGSIIQEIADSIGVHIATLYRWRDEHPAFNDLWLDEEDRLIEKVGASLLKRALGFEYEEVKATGHLDEKGEFVADKIERVMKHSLPDVGAAMCILTNRDPENWKHRQEYHHVVDEKQPLIIIETDSEPPPETEAERSSEASEDTPTLVPE